MAAQLGLFPKKLSDGISNSKLLVIGAGGIGCEVLKNLVLCGFPKIEIIDLDTIDLSNLNRQFLFRHEHIGKSKAKVAREAVLKFNPNVQITAYHDTIMSEDYGVNFFKRFDVVLSALDNKAARNHVNRMCLNADVPLIESGTAGYNGQIEIIKRGLTQCYECSFKTKEKTFPGCTIRNTPSEPIHCIVWAKHLFNQLFGETVDDEDISPDMADADANTEPSDIKDAAEAIKETETGNIKRISTRQWATECSYNPIKLFDKFFSEDIKYLISMSHLWAKRKAPEPVTYTTALQTKLSNGELKNAGTFDHHKLWTLDDCAQIFELCLQKLRDQVSQLDEGDFLVWDKDDSVAMDFVAACANIRAYIFNIERKSRFEIKSMAGNIVPAVATTNAMTAGVAVMRALSVVQGQLEKCKAVYVRQEMNGFKQVIVPEKLFTKPNPNCVVCSAEPAIHLQIDTKRARIKELRDHVLIKTLNMLRPDVSLDSNGTIIISSDEDETDENIDEKFLFEFKVVDGTILNCDDFVQNYSIKIIICHKEAERDEEPFKILSDINDIKPKPEIVSTDDGPTTSKRVKLSSALSAENNIIDDDDDLEIVEPELDLNSDLASSVEEKLTVKIPKKRAINIEQDTLSVELATEENGSAPAKRIKFDGIIEID